AGSPADGKVDLLTVLLHELGHELGLADMSDGGAMNDTLDLGQRRTPSTEEVDAVFQQSASDDGETA
ncbi:MAG: hypothetical protein B7Z73_14790, partial [Planctomycetia bacterium 21-64-5]